MAKAAIQAQLDALLGKERNVPVAERTNRQVRFYDDEIDKHWLCGCSPHILFKNSRSDLGPWEYVEDESAKAEWDALSQEKRDEWGFDYELCEYLRGLVEKLDLQIKRARDKLASEQNQKIALAPATQAQVDELAAQIKALQEEANTLGEAGEVDESMKKMAAVEEIKKKKEVLENPQFPGKEKIMEVCDICCNYMANTDSEVRKAEHLAGKQHMGWKAIREKLTEMQALNDGRGPPRRRRDLKDLIAEHGGGGKGEGDSDKKEPRSSDKRRSRSREKDRDADRRRDDDRRRRDDDRRDRDRYESSRYSSSHRDYRDRDRRDDYRRRDDDRRRERSRERDYRESRDRY